MLTRFAIAVLLLVLALGAALVSSKYHVEPDHVSGVIEADEIRVGSRVGGRVQKVLVEEGDRVKAGDVLVELEPFDLIDSQREAQAVLEAREADLKRMESGMREEEVAQAQARYEQLQARLDALVAGPRPQEIEASAARVATAEAERRLATEIYNRTAKLRESNAATQQELDRAIEALDVASGATTTRQKELSLLQAGTREEEIREARAKVEEARLAAQLAKKGYRDEEIAAARASRDAAKASLEAIGSRIAELSIRSPIDGVVESLDIRQGDQTAAASPALSIIDIRHLWVRAYVPENRLDIASGQPAEVTVDSFPDRRFKATITFIARQAEFTPSNVQTPEERVKQVFRIKATLDEGLDVLRPGMPADVWLNTKDAKGEAP